MAAEEILIEIDATLDQLIRNAEAIGKVDIDELSLMEIEAFQKTQESLIQHLVHTDERLEAKRKGLFALDKRSASFKIAEKRARFEKLKTSVHNTISNAVDQKLPILSKRRSKRFLIPF